MINEHLKEAMNKKRVSVDAIARATEVDPKTVQRWINGRVPHTRHRWVICQILKEDESYLWNQEENSSHTKACTAEVIAAYAHRSDVPSASWWDLITKAEQQIDLLGFALLFLPEQHPELEQLLKEKSQLGCRIRIAMADPMCSYVEERDKEEELEGTLSARIYSTIRHFKNLQHMPNIEIGFHQMPLYNSVFRFDDEMFVTPHLYKLHGSKAPLMHLRKLSPNGIFSNFAGHFESVWVTTKPLEELPVNTRKRK